MTKKERSLYATGFPSDSKYRYLQLYSPSIPIAIHFERMNWISIRRDRELFLYRNLIKHIEDLFYHTVPFEATDTYFYSSTPSKNPRQEQSAKWNTPTRLNKRESSKSWGFHEYRIPNSENPWAIFKSPSKKLSMSTDVATLKPTLPRAANPDKPKCSAAFQPYQ